MSATVASEVCRNILYARNLEFGDGVRGHRMRSPRTLSFALRSADLMLAASGSTIIQVSA
jgi:hypothetical protein